MPQIVELLDDYDLIVIGAGTAAAKYLHTLRNQCRQSGTAISQLQLPPLTILVIGSHDPWGNARAYDPNMYTKNINQAAQLVIDNEGLYAETSQAPVDRKEWAAQNALIIEQITQGHIVVGEVTYVKRNALDQKFEVTAKTLSVSSDNNTNNSSVITFKAKKIAIATGAGIEENKREYHWVPDWVRTFQNLQLSQVINNAVTQENLNMAKKNCMDLDQFQHGENGSKIGNAKSVAVVGPAAGTDAIMEASTRGYPLTNVHWFISGDTPPAIELTWNFTKGNPRATFNQEQAKTRVVRYTKDLTLAASPNGKILITSDQDPFKDYEVDYFVYALGQRNAFTSYDETAKKNTSFLDPALKKDLEPIYDVNQRMGEFGSVGSSGAWQHAVGLQLGGTTSDTGMVVVGAAAAQAARGIDHNYLQREFEEFQTRLKSMSTVFEVIAQEAGFPELFQKLTLAQTFGATDTWSFVGVDYEAKSKWYLAKLKSKLIENIQATIGADLPSVALRDALAQMGYNAASDLCYMFQLRVKAGQYLFESKPTMNDPTKSEVVTRKDKDVLSLLSAGLKRNSPVPVSDSRLIGGVERNVSAVNEDFKTQHVTTLGGINFLEDATVIRKYIEVHYPNISSDLVDNFIDEVIRTRTDENHMRGFDRYELGALEARLKKYEENARTPKGFVFQTILR